jgi:hypothetical protein
MANARVKTYFRDARDELVSAYNRTKSIQHAPSTGAAREYIVSSFLQKFYPQKYVFGSGEIIDARGNTSTQCDIVVYDESMPVIRHGLIDQYLAEGVLCAIEIKSNMSAAQLRESLTKAAAIKRLHRDLDTIFHYGVLPESIPCFIISFDFSSKYQTFISCIESHNEANEVNHRIDGAFVIEKGFYYSAQEGAPVFRESGKDVMGHAFAALSEAFWKSWHAKPNFQKYVED